MLVSQVFDKARDSYWCNTSYPLVKENWSMYKKDSFELFKNEQKLSIYIHIPFCKKLCSFCEYVKFPKNDQFEKQYIKILEKDIEKFILQNPNFILYGFDIGGGTPTVLNDESFYELLVIAKKILSLNKVSDFEPSIEATFNTLTENKIKLIKEAGFSRISLGIQTTNLNILKNSNRDNSSLSNILETIKLIRQYGIKKVNIDFMYGLENQNIDDLNESIEVIKMINPEQITLYEMRYNMVSRKLKISKEALYEQYKFLYEQLIKLGYSGHFGQNTFTKNAKDLGLSSYLRYRMIDNISYKGFGISAQSKSKLGISYNIGKNKESLMTCLDNNTFCETDIYVLPKEELFAKYIAISLYYGSFDLLIAKDILESNPLELYKESFDFLINNNYINIVNNTVYLTELGFKYYGAIGALFYSKEVQDWLLGGNLDV